MIMNKLKYAAIFAVFSSAMSSFAATDTSTPAITIIDNIGVTAGTALNFGTLLNDVSLDGTSTNNTIAISTAGAVTLGSGITATTEHLEDGKAAGQFDITGPGTLSIELSHAGGDLGVQGIDTFVCTGVTGLSDTACNAGNGAEATDIGTVTYGGTLELANTVVLNDNALALGTITITVVSA